jgi:hypothetical protein
MVIEGVDVPPGISKNVVWPQVVGPTERAALRASEPLLRFFFFKVVARCSKLLRNVAEAT